MRHIAIVGSRARSDRETVDLFVARLPTHCVVVSGGAPGPDTWAEQAAGKHGLAVKVFRPDLEGARSQGQLTKRYHRRNWTPQTRWLLWFRRTAPAALRIRSNGRCARAFR